MKIWLCVLALLAQEDRTRELRELRASVREKRAEAARLLKAAHEALDRGEYEEAAAGHRKSRERAAEAETLAGRERAIVEAAAEALVRDLNRDEPEARDRASSGLVTLGPGALPVLERLLEGAGTAEVRARLTDVVALLRSMEVDDRGRLHQWAEGARASSQYTDSSWSAAQATGKPDTQAAGDAQSAWATLTEDAAEEWLELTYRFPVRPAEIRVHETFNPGAVVKIEARDAEGKWHALWQAAKREPTAEKIRWFAPAFTSTVVTKAIRLTLDSAGVPGWNEIDAVELVGEAILDQR